jgi:hypothetical protein
MAAIVWRILTGATTTSCTHDGVNLALGEINNKKKRIQVKRSISTISLLLAMLLSSLSHGETKAPTFEQYPSETIYKGKPAAVDLESAPDARRFRTVLREGAKKGPNFAGHYAIVEWGCGTSCATIAVVDVKKGHVFFPKISPLGFPGLEEGNQLMDQYGTSYRKDSRLLIVNGIPSNKNKVGSYYYIWEAGKFKLIFSREWESTFNK